MYLKGPHFYECNVHVPLIMAWPGRIPAGRECDALVELVDLAPTLCDAVGVEKDPGMQGRSLWPILTGHAPVDVFRKNVYSEYYNSNIKHKNPLAFDTMVFDGRYKLVKVHDRDGQMVCCGELYDLWEDPTETHNRYGDPAYLEVQANMLAQLCDRMAETCDPLPVRKACW